MNKSLGMIEVIGLSSAIEIADVMAKTSNIQISGLERTRGFGYMLIKIVGDVGAVKSAVSAGECVARENGFFVASKVITRVHESVSEKMDIDKKESERIKKLDKDEKIIKDNKENEKTKENDSKISIKDQNETIEITEDLENNGRDSKVEPENTEEVGEEKTAARTTRGRSKTKTVK